MKKVHNPKPFQGNRIPTPLLPPDNRFIHNHPIFCLRYLHQDYNVELCSDDDRASMIRKMAKLSKMTWDDIKMAPRHGMGSEKISRNSIRPSIPMEITPDVDSFLSLRYSGKKAFIGFRNHFIFHIIYIDRNFSVYNH